MVVNGYAATLGRAFEILPQERRLARVRHPDERGVGQELQPELEVRLVAGQARLGEARRLARGGREALVPAAARAAARENRARLRVREVGDELPVLVEHLRPHGDAELDGLAVRAVLARPASAAAAPGREPAPRAEGRQVAQIRVRGEHDVAAAPSVTAVGSALRHVFLPAEAERAVTAAPRLHVDAGAIREHAAVAGG